MSQTYAFVSHDSAIEAIWHLARTDAIQYDDFDVWALPEPYLCVHTQRGFTELAGSIDLVSHGICSRPVDLLVPSSASLSRGRRARFHVWKDTIAERSFMRVEDRLFVSTPHFVVLQLASARPPTSMARADARLFQEQEDILRAELGFSPAPFNPDDLLKWQNVSRLVRTAHMASAFAGTYRPATRQHQETLYGMPPLMTFAEFEDYLSRCARIKGAERARTALALAFEGCASPLEASLALMLTLPVCMGGFGLSQPSVNKSIVVDQALRDLVSQEEAFADLAWLEGRTIVEFDGWESHGALGPAKIARDNDRANSLEALGWHVLRVTMSQLSSVAGVTRLAKQIAQLTGQTLDEPTELQRIWRDRLHKQLFFDDSRCW